jgi:uncharacterized membrane protein YcaP (DUF421 family)
VASIFARTFIIYIIIAFALRLMGKRQIGELEVSELVSTLLISEIAALPIADPDIPLLNAIVPVLFIFSLEIIISSLKNKSEKLKKFVEGEPVFLIFKGELKESALRQSRLSINELLCEARLQGIGDVSDINYAILEQNGQISFLKSGPDEKIALPLIIDGEIKEESLTQSGISKKKLLAELKKRSLSIDRIFLLTADEEKNLNIYIKEETENDS